MGLKETLGTLKVSIKKVSWRFDIFILHSCACSAGKQTPIATLACRNFNSARSDRESVLGETTLEM
jgi:hypothetical protein